MGIAAGRRDVERLVDDYYQPLYRYAFRLSGSIPDAEDLTQEAFCKAQQNLHQLRDWDRAKPWLFRILRNCYLHRLRSEPQACISLDSIDEIAELTPEPLESIDPKRLQQALNDMPEVFRSPIILYYFEDFSYRDIADQMDLPIGTVMSRLARAKSYLRSRLNQPVHAATSEGFRRATDGL